MKQVWFSALCLLLSAMLAALIPTEAEGGIYEDTVRLHILANSDDEADQALKLEIRDKLLLTYGNSLAVGATAEEVKTNLEAMIPEIEAETNAWLCEAGISYRARVVLGTEWYETREYEDFVMPRGSYTSLRVILGKGEGHNWWCVMFPPLCLDMAIEEEESDDAILSYTDSEIRLIRDNDTYRIKFKILELFSDLCREKTGVGG